MRAPSDDYAGREQTLVKHFILRKHLERFAHIVGFRWDSITYVDCFAGPWNVRSENLADSSFAIALRELRNARATLAERGRQIGIRCFFLEKNPAAFARLREYCGSISDAEVSAVNADLETSVPKIVDFVRQGGPKSFPFIFVDPTGWTGFEMARIEPLLRLSPGEVLINFMTGHLRRFLESPDGQTQESFVRLFGSPTFRARVHGLSGMDREDAAVQEYSSAVRRTGKFTYSCTAIVLHPELDRTHFHLIYATRNRKGIEVFKDAERKAMELMEKARADAQQRRRESRSGQAELFGAEPGQTSSHYDSLRERYMSRSRALVLALLETRGSVLYDEAWELVLSQPLTWEIDLKEWLRGWRDEERLVIEGMEPKQRVPKLDASNKLIWRG